MEDEVGDERLLQRGREALDQLVREPRMKPTVSVSRYRRPSCSNDRVVGSSVSKSRSSMEASAPVSALSSVDLPTFV